MPELKKKKYSWMPHSLYLVKLMQSPPGILAINWLFQGIRGMQSKELSFRVLIEILVAAIFYLFLCAAGSTAMNLLLSFIMAHTFNWLFNTHLWVCVRYFPCYRRDPDALSKFLSTIEDSLRSAPWLKEAVCIGSIGGRAKVFSERSDIDLRLIFPPGFFAWLRTNLMLIKLRVMALIHIIPLDLYAYNDPLALRRFREDEGVRIIVDRDNRLLKFYGDRANRV